jgi:hypothetical protein
LTEQLYHFNFVVLSPNILKSKRKSKQGTTTWQHPAMPGADIRTVGSAHNHQISGKNIDVFHRLRIHRSSIPKNTQYFLTLTCTFLPRPLPSVVEDQGRYTNPTLSAAR